MPEHDRINWLSPPGLIVDSKKLAVWLRVDGGRLASAYVPPPFSSHNRERLKRKWLGHSTLLCLFLPPNPSSWCARCRVPALHKGSEIKRTLQVYVDDVLAATWASSGDTPGFESIDLSGSSGSIVVVTTVLADMEWIGINEVGSEFHPFMLAFRRTTTVVLSLSLLLLLSTSALELLSLARHTLSFTPGYQLSASSQHLHNSQTR